MSAEDKVRDLMAELEAFCQRKAVWSDPLIVNLSLCPGHLDELLADLDLDDTEAPK